MLMRVIEEWQKLIQEIKGKNKILAKAHSAQFASWMEQNKKKKELKLNPQNPPQTLYTRRAYRSTTHCGPSSDLKQPRISKSPMKQVSIVTIAIATEKVIDITHPV